MTGREVHEALARAGYDEVEGLCAQLRDDSRKQVRRDVEAALRRHARERAERERVSAMYDLQVRLGGEGLVLGVDEVGRGAVAGPLTVAAVALPQQPRVWGINDSKKLSPRRRGELALDIADVATAIGIAHVEPASIDAVGMAACLRFAMRQAIEDAGVDPDAVLIDGNPVHVHPRERTIVRGDAQVASIAAASIVAKVTRDRIMVEYDSVYPGYHLAQSKGYGSAQHIAAIRERGLTPIHRSTFCVRFLEGSDPA